MPDNQSTHEEKVRSFWDRDIKTIHESGVKEPFDRWMVVRAEQYLAAHPHRKLAVQTPADVDAYLADLGRRARGQSCNHAFSRTPRVPAPA